MISDGENGLLADFFDIEGLAGRAPEVLRDPAAYRPLASRAASLIKARYALDVTIPRLVDLLERARKGYRAAFRAEPSVLAAV